MRQPLSLFEAVVPATSLSATDLETPKANLQATSAGRLHVSLVVALWLVLSIVVIGSGVKTLGTLADTASPRTHSAADQRAP